MNAGVAAEGFERLGFALGRVRAANFCEHDLDGGCRMLESLSGLAFGHLLARGRMVINHEDFRGHFIPLSTLLGGLSQGMLASFLHCF